MIQKIVKLMGFSKNTYFNWQKENRPIISLVKKYFSEEEIDEFLKSNQIKKFELINNFTYEELANLIHQNSKIDNIRLYEIIDFFKSHTLVYLKTSFSKILHQNGYTSGIYINTLDTIDKQQFLFQLQKIFKEANWDDVVIKINAINVLKDFSNETNFNFEKEDLNIILEILFKFEMYDRLFNIERN